MSTSEVLTVGLRTGAQNLRVDLPELKISFTGPFAAVPYVSTCLDKARTGDKTFEQYSECRLTNTHIVLNTLIGITDFETG